MKKIRNWQKYFTYELLRQGKSLFDDAAVSDLKVTDTIISGEVADVFENREVRIIYDEEGIRSMHCNCYRGSSRQHCKHEAALLYAYEGYDERSFSDPFAADFKDSSDYYFNLYRLTRNYRFRKKDVEEAEKLIQNRTVVLDEVRLGFSYGRDSEQSLYAIARFNKAIQNEYASVTMTRDAISEIICSKYTCSGYNNFNYYRFLKKNDLCVHKIALLLLLKDYILRNNPGDITDYSGNYFLSSFMGSRGTALAEDEKEKSIVIEPRFEYDERHFLKLSFKAGKERLYVVRNIEEFHAAVKQKKEYALTSKQKIDFARDSISEASLKYFAFIEDALNDERQRDTIRVYEEAYRDSHYFSIHSYIILYGKRIDEIFDMLKGEEAEINNKVSGRKYRLGFIDRDPDLSIFVDSIKDDGGFQGLRIRGDFPKIIMGSRSAYYFLDDYLCRVSGDTMEIISSLQNIVRGDRIDASIGKKHLAQFYNHVLPRLKDRIDVVMEDEEELQRYVPHKPEFNYYFDVSEGNIMCLVNVGYGEDTFNLFNVPVNLEGRDYIEERNVASLLNRYFDLISDEKILYTEGNDDNIYSILENLIPELMETGDVHATEAFDHLKVKRKTNVSVAVSIDNDLLELDIDTDDMSLEDLVAVIGSYRLKKKYHKLKNGELIRTDDESIESLDQMLSSLNISLKDLVKGKLDLPVYRALYLDKLLDEESGIYDERDVRFRRLVKEFKTVKEAEYEVPESLKGIMRGYQKEGFRWLKTLSQYGFGGILADEMGLGKTLQMMSLLLDHKQDSGDLQALIVCPSSLIYNWLSEVEKFVPELDAVVVAGTPAERKQIIDGYQEHDILITSYELLRRDIALYEDKQFTFEILDEAQYIKTASTANAKTCKVIRARKRFALTGTPIENNLSELWSIFDYLMPGFLYSHEKFRQIFETVIVKENDEKASEALKNMIAPFILRRKKKDVLADLPDKIEETIRVRFGDIQRKLYDSQVLKISKTISDSSDEAFEKSKIAILAELMKIRQICCEPSLIFEDYDGESAKKEACIEMVRNAIEEGHKILLFSQFTSMLEVIEKQLDKEKIRYYKITGQTKKEDRLRLVETFNINDVPVFLISLKAGGTGLNLTGADIVIHYDPWWNIAAQNQATDRTHRIGQKKVVTVYRIIAENSIEEKILDLQDKKAELAENILSGEGTSIASLSREELLDLLSVK